MNEASHVVVFCAINNIKNFEREILQTLPESSIENYYTYKKPLGDNALNAWLINQVYIALGFFLSACATMDIDATPMNNIEENKYDDILQLDGYNTVVAAAISYRSSDERNQPAIKPKYALPLEIVTHRPMNYLLLVSFNDNF